MLQSKAIQRCVQATEDLHAALDQRQQVLAGAGDAPYALIAAAAAETEVRRLRDSPRQPLPSRLRLHNMRRSTRLPGDVCVAGPGARTPSPHTAIAPPLLPWLSFLMLRIRVQACTGAC